MKKVLILLLVIPLFSWTSEVKKNPFVGKWVGEDNGKVNYITFNKEGYAFFEIEGQIWGGKEFVYRGKKGKMTYEINAGVDPVQVDFIITLLESEEKVKMLCIAEFINKHTMRFASNFGKGNRPAEFNSKNAITLKRERK